MVYYGIWNSYKKQWQFDIKEPSKTKAWNALYKKIGKSAYKWRFEVKALPTEKKVKRDDD